MYTEVANVLMHQVGPGQLPPSLSGEIEWIDSHDEIRDNGTERYKKFVFCVPIPSFRHLDFLVITTRDIDIAEFFCALILSVVSGVRGHSGRAILNVRH